MAQDKRIIIIGGGFAGINLALKLSGADGLQVILVDKNNYNFFPPLLYQVATGYLDVSNISYPFRKFFQHKKNLHFVMGSFKKVIPSENRIETDTCSLNYDYLVFATGTETNYFGMENVKKHAVPMKTIPDAVALRNHILLQAEKAARTTDAEERKRLLTFVVAGAGPTGVEVSGMLAEMNRLIFKKDYPELAALKLHIYLVDALPVVLNPMSKKSQEETLSALKKLGINVKLELTVKDYQDGKVCFADGQCIETETLIWTSGVIATELPGLPEQSVGKGRRLLVDAFNRVEHTDNIYAIGDVCLQTSDESFPKGHPQVAQVAIQQGKNLAKNFKRLVNAEQQLPFTYKDKGSLAVIGNYKAVADLPGLHFKGFVAYVLWLLVHLFSLASYRNQVKTLYNWMIAFFTKDQSLRLIIRTEQARKTEDTTA